MSDSDRECGERRCETCEHALVLHYDHETGLMEHDCAVRAYEQDAEYGWAKDCPEWEKKQVGFCPEHGAYDEDDGCVQCLMDDAEAADRELEELERDCEHASMSA